MTAPEAVVPPFAVISGAQVQRVLQGREKQIVELVEATYRPHGAGDSVDPPSYFLRFPDRPTARIIALPASIGGLPGWTPEVDLQLPGERGSRHPARLGRAEPQRPRHRLPLRLLVNVFKPGPAIAANPAAFPLPPTLDNIIILLSRSDRLFWASLTNSVLVTTLSVIVLIVFSAMLGHYLACSQGRWVWPLTLVLLAGLMIPPQVILLPITRCCSCST
jgi:hypothetical protein